jgi:hypothetical protein
MLEIHAIARSSIRVEGLPTEWACEAGNRNWQSSAPFPTAAVLGGDLNQGGPELTERSEFIPGTMFQGVQPIQ